MFIVRIAPFVGRVIKRKAESCVHDFCEFGEAAFNYVCSMIGFLIAVIVTPIALPIRALAIRRKDEADAPEILAKLSTGKCLSMREREMCFRGLKVFPDAKFYQEILDLDKANAAKIFAENPEWRGL